MRFALLLLALPLAAQQAPCTSTVTGELQILPLKSAIFGNTRNLRVWLPPGYSDPANASKRYPVLYMLDGQNLFDACTSFDHVHEWRLDEALTNLIGYRAIRPVIAVGIDNTAARSHEYLPYKDNVFYPQSPEPAGKQFPEFIEREVMPVVRERYRIENGPANTAIGGSSYGAIAALYALLTRSDLFGSGIVESPSLQVGNGQLLRDTSLLAKGPARVYIGMGTSEFGPDAKRAALNAGLVRMVRMLEANLRASALNSPEVFTVVRDGAVHNEAAWSERLPEALRFLFGVR